MKIFLALFFAFSLLFLTSCHQGASASASNTLQTENTSSQTTETTQTVETTTQKIPEQTETPFPSEISEHLKGQLVGIGTNKSFIELPSRILFTATLSKDYPVDDEYWGTSSNYLSYYSKADGELYVSCFDPLCDHYGCSAVGFVSVGSSQFFIGDRFYEISSLGQITSFSFDGTDRRLEFDAGYGEYLGVQPWSKNRLAYDRYIYIDFLTENEEHHTLRYDTETKTMEDLTEKTGNYILALYAYNGEIYGRDANGLAIRTDLSLSYTKSTKEVYEMGSYDLSLGSRMIGIAKGKNEETGRMTELLGIHIYDMETEEYLLLTNEQLGHTVTKVLWADETYCYFFVREPVYIGISHQKSEVYNYTGGKIYRVKYDGTDCTCIYENPNLKITDIYIYENTVFASACRLDIHAGIAQTWDSSTYIGKIDENGMIESLEWAEVIA